MGQRHVPRVITEADVFVTKELVRLRENLGLTRSQAAKKIGIAQSTLTAVEERTANGSWIVQDKIAKGYGIFVLDLVALLRFGQWPVTAVLPT